MKDLIKIKGAFIPTILTSRTDIEKADKDVRDMTSRVRVGDTNDEPGNTTKNYWIFKGL